MTKEGKLTDAWLQIEYYSTFNFVFTSISFPVTSQEFNHKTSFIRFYLILVFPLIERNAIANCYDSCFQVICNMQITILWSRNINLFLEFIDLDSILIDLRIEEFSNDMPQLHLVA